MRVNAKTNIGLVRQTNEDSYACVEPKFYIVADGMGGHVAGEIASSLVVDTVKDFFNKIEYDEMVNESVLHEAIIEANKLIFEKAVSCTEYRGMGTTITLVYFKNNQCLWAHVGDSRIYLYRDGTLKQLTSDHSLVWDLVANGTITEYEASIHPQRNLLTRAVGVQSQVEIDTGVFVVQEKDKILLCSDGLTNMLNNEKIKEVIQSTALEETADFLVEAAMEAGGIDNITAIMIEI